MKLLVNKCRPIWNPVLALGIGAAASAALPVSPVEDEQVPLVCGSEVGDIYSVGTEFCFKISNLRRLDEEVDKLLGIDVRRPRVSQ